MCFSAAMIHVAAARVKPCECLSLVLFLQRGGLILQEIYIGFCPRIDFHNIMHNDCLTYNYSICDIVSHLPIRMVKK